MALLAVRSVQILVVNVLILATIVLAFRHIDPRRQLVDFQTSPNAVAEISAQPVQQQWTVDKTLVELYLRSLKLSILGVPLQSDAAFETAAAEDPAELPLGEQSSDSGGTDSELIVGAERFDNVKELLLDANLHSVAGDFVECGVWQGGTSIYAKAVLTAFGLTEYRHVHVVDSFQGAPRTSDGTSTSIPAASQEQITARFQRYGLLDETVHIWKGSDFRNSVPQLRDGILGSAGAICVLRADGSTFASVMDILFNAYDLVSLSGWVIIDDWRIKECRDGVKKFFELHSQSVKVMPIHNTGGGYFKKTKNFELDMTWYQRWNENGRQTPSTRKRRRKGKKRRKANNP